MNIFTTKDTCVKIFSSLLLYKMENSSSRNTKEVMKEIESNLKA
jgi:hypothetical protein